LVWSERREEKRGEEGQWRSVFLPGFEDMSEVAGPEGERERERGNLESFCSFSPIQTFVLVLIKVEELAH